ncbi:MAG: hypothetical protein JSW58_07490 [Candidatus Latescibacterota bacterium]|nr:MAG: hypothetical protein JSW58_07490 [Candidatus Latescibacterota bacterium]
MRTVLELGKLVYIQNNLILVHDDVFQNALEGLDSLIRSEDVEYLAEILQALSHEPCAKVPRYCFVDLAIDVLKLTPERVLIPL